MSLAWKLSEYLKKAIDNTLNLKISHGGTTTRRLLSENSITPPETLNLKKLTKAEYLTGHLLPFRPKFFYYPVTNMRLVLDGITLVSSATVKNLDFC